MARWRICYKRSMFDKANRGYKKRDSFAFFKDDYLRDDYAAFINYQEGNDPSWYIFARIFKGKFDKEYILLDCEGKSILENPTIELGEKFFTMFLRDNNPSPYDFCCMIGARKDLIELYKKHQ